jgi:hypothetical protein
MAFHIVVIINWATREIIYCNLYLTEEDAVLGANDFLLSLHDDEDAIEVHHKTLTLGSLSS